MYYVVLNYKKRIVMVSISLLDDDITKASYYFVNTKMVPIKLQRKIFIILIIRFYIMKHLKIKKHSHKTY